MSESCCHLPVGELAPNHHESSQHQPHAHGPNLKRVIAALALAGLSFVFAMPHWIGLDPSPITALVSAVASSLVVLFFGMHFIRAIGKIFKTSDMNTLVGFGIVAAFALSIWNFRKGVSHYYFDSAAFIAALVILGQYIESMIRQAVNRQMSSLVGLLPAEARLIANTGEIFVRPEELKVGDRVRVLVGERVPVDGKLISASSFDESVLTGESRPVDRAANQSVVQGSLNVGQPVDFDVERISENSLYRQMVKSVQTSLKERPPLQKRVDKIATIFVPVVVVLAAAAAYFWKKQNPDSDIFVVTSLSILVIACPCALGLATPMAFLAGVYGAGRRGILLKSLDAIEKSSDIAQIAFDKTGTLTVGEPSVQRLKSVENISHRDLLQMAASVERRSEHPYAKAILKKSVEEKVEVPEVSDLHVASGKGVRGSLRKAGKESIVCVGNLVWLYENGYDSTKIPQELVWDAEGTHETALWVGVDQKVIGVIFVSDQLRSEAKEVIRKIQDEGYVAGMITGDAENVAKHFAKELNLKFFHAGVLPEEKATIVKRLSAPKKKGMDLISEEVAFVGDGVNDAPALAEARLGIAMGSGAALSQTTADLVLLSNDLSQIPIVFEVLKNTRSLITQNLILSFGYNIVAIPIAAGILYPKWGLLLNPGIAALAMAGSSVAVLLNSLRAMGRLHR